MGTTREQIHASDDFILAEIEHLRVLYTLKQIIRYHLVRNEEMDTESVAEHVFGMLTISRYFLPLEDAGGEWDRMKIDDMILYHDIDEIETGDTIGYLKTPEMRERERSAAQRVISTIPGSLREHITAVLQEYEEQISPESRFVKALDRLEPVFHLYDDNGKRISNYHNATYEQHMSIKRSVLADFPVLQRFNEVASEEMKRRGYFTQELPLS